MGGQATVKHRTRTMFLFQIPLISYPSGGLEKLIPGCYPLSPVSKTSLIDRDFTQLHKRWQSKSVRSIRIQTGKRYRLLKNFSEPVLADLSLRSSSEKKVFTYNNFLYIKTH